MSTDHFDRPTGVIGRLDSRVAVVFGAGASDDGVTNGQAAALTYGRAGARRRRRPFRRRRRANRRVDHRCGRPGDRGDRGPTDPEAAAAVDAALAAFGTIDVLHNNIGATVLGDPLELDYGDWRCAFVINVDTVFLTVKHVLPIMFANRHGAIVNVSSIGALRDVGYPYPAYMASKAAVDQLTVAPAIEYAAEGIRANAVAPGFIDTPWSGASFAARPNPSPRSSPHDTPPARPVGWARAGTWPLPSCSWQATRPHTSTRVPSHRRRPDDEMPPRCRWMPLSGRQGERNSVSDVEMVPTDITDGQVPEQWRATHQSLRMSGKDRAACDLGEDTTSEYRLTADSQPRAGVPRGELLRFRWAAGVYSGVERNVWLYVPAQATPDKQVNLLVCNDGFRYFGPEVNATAVLDNLIHRGEIPVTAGLFVAAGEVGPGTPIWGGTDNRSVEYDTVNGDYARFLVDELFPVVRSRVDLTDDPAGRAICGISSGGAGAMTAAFFRPDQFGNVISHCGSFVNIRGAHELPVMIRQTPRKAIRVWHQSGSRDLDVIFGSLPLANAELAAALAYRRYDSRYEFGTGGHTLRHGGAVFPEALRWIWRDQPCLTEPY